MTFFGLPFHHSQEENRVTTFSLSYVLMKMMTSPAGGSFSPDSTPLSIIHQLTSLCKLWCWQQKKAERLRGLHTLVCVL